MKRFDHFLRTMCFVLCIGTASIAVPAQSLPEAVSTNGLLYMTGGIGEEEAKAFLSLAPRYSLRMMFTSPGGGYLADVGVRIADAGGKTLLDTRTGGPFLYIMLPAGRYRVIANAGGPEVARWVTVPRRGGTDFHLPLEERAARGTNANCPRCRPSAGL